MPDDIEIESGSDGIVRSPVDVPLPGGEPMPVSGKATGILPVNNGDEPLVDPDCRSNKHASCVGEPCECDCHAPTPVTQPYPTGTQDDEADEGPWGPV